MGAYLLLILHYLTFIPTIFVSETPTDVARLQSAITTDSQRAEARRWIETLAHTLFTPAPVLT